MSQIANFALMAEYNQWMNRNLYSAAETLTAAELELDRGAFFGSIIGSLNHILIADIIWLKRFANQFATSSSLDEIRILVMPNKLGGILHKDFQQLARARQQIDQIILDFIGELDDKDVEGDLDYSNMRGEMFSRKFAHILQHFFNHQTHHRGQITTLLSQAEVDVGVTDLLAIIPNNSKS